MTVQTLPPGFYGMVARLREELNAAKRASDGTHQSIATIQQELSILQEQCPHPYMSLYGACEDCGKVIDISALA